MALEREGEGIVAGTPLRKRGRKPGRMKGRYREMRPMPWFYKKEKDDVSLESK